MVTKYISARTFSRKNILLCSVFALTLGGFVLYEPLTQSQGQPAFAQTGLFGSQPQSFADVVEKVQPAVVSVRVKSGGVERAEVGDLPFFFRDLPPNHPLRRFFDNNPGTNENRGQPPRRPQERFGMAQGSGFFISEDGYVVTNNHVIENAKTVELVTNDGKTLEAKVIGTDPRTDIALLKVDSKEKFPFVKFASTLPRVGDWVVAIGNPFGLGGSVTAGIVSARGRDIGAGPYDDFLQIDAAVNRGNSGGPTFNFNGEVIGVNTAIYSPSGGNVGIAFAVPSNLASTIVSELQQSGSVSRGWLGVQIQTISKDIADSIGRKEEGGALVVDAQRGSPGERAGLRAGDAVLEVNGDAVADARDLSRKIGALKPDTTTELTVLRDGKQIKVQVKLGAQPQNPGLNNEQDTEKPTPETPHNSQVLKELGLELQSAKSVAGAGGEGVVITSIAADSAVGERLSAGDIILNADGTVVSTASDVEKAIVAARGNNQKFILMRIKSGQSTRFVAIPVNKE